MERSRSTLDVRTANSLLRAAIAAVTFSAAASVDASAAASAALAAAASADVGATSLAGVSRAPWNAAAVAI